jgi:hypothetical protein
MGLFGPKKSDSITAAALEGHAHPSGAPAALSQPPGRGAPVVTGHPPPPASRLGIDEVMQLVRLLPMEKETKLVTSVLKTTLEFIHIRVADIVVDAATRLRDLEAHRGQLKQEIASMEGEIARRHEELGRLEKHHRETMRVRELLETDPDDLEDLTREVTIGQFIDRE